MRRRGSRLPRDWLTTLLIEFYFLQQTSIRGIEILMGDKLTHLIGSLEAFVAPQIYGFRDCPDTRNIKFPITSAVLRDSLHVHAIEFIERNNVFLHPNY